jgi:hypothetical protein
MIHDDLVQSYSISRRGPNLFREDESGANKSRL